uniref:GLOBIN domain-containing protein n=1 Tax=Caenorhabditis tropicalis TaxID=1561998 RepID=A0A1I7UX36_9PELO
MESLSHLTPIDREILNKSWGIVSKDMQQVAVNIFQMIFEQAPDAKLMFSFMMKDYKEDKKSNEFIFHAVRFLQVIESTMTHLDDPSQLDAVFLNLGKIHAKHEEQLGFSAHYWSVFKECVLFHFRKAMKSHNKFSKHREMSFAEIDSAIILWREVLRFIIDRMKVGYTESGAIRKSNKQAINGQHSISGDDSGGLSVETKQDLTQVNNLLIPTSKNHRMASRHSVALCRLPPPPPHHPETPSSSPTCSFLKTIASSMSPKCVRRRFSLSPASQRTHV